MGMQDSRRSSGVMPMVRLSASASQTSAPSLVAIPRGSPVEPEVSLTTPTVLATRAGCVTPDTVETVQSVSDPPATPGPG